MVTTDRDIPSLPNEIIIEIISSLRPTYFEEWDPEAKEIHLRTLARCCRVSHFWRRVTQPLLATHLATSPRVKIRKLVLDLKTQPQIMKDFLRTARMEGTGQDAEYLLRGLRDCPSLDELSLRDLRIAMVYVATYLPFLRVLYLNGCKFAWRSDDSVDLGQPSSRLRYLSVFDTSLAGYLGVHLEYFPNLVGLALRNLTIPPHIHPELPLLRHVSLIGLDRFVIGGRGRDALNYSISRPTVQNVQINAMALSLIRYSSSRELNDLHVTYLTDRQLDRLLDEGVQSFLRAFKRVILVGPEGEASIATGLPKGLAAVEHCQGLGLLVQERNIPSALHAAEFWRRSQSNEDFYLHR